MKILKFALPLMILLSSVSCIFEEVPVNITDEVEEGLPVTVRLNYAVEGNDIITKAAQPSRYEYRVRNLYIFVFRQDGSLHYHGFFDASSGLNVNNGETATTGSVEFQTTSANRTRIVGIANVETASLNTAYDITVDDLDAVTSLDELSRLTMNMEDAALTRGSTFMMTGYAKLDADQPASGSNIQINIPPGKEGGSEVPELECIIQLERTDAKVAFNVHVEAPAGSGWTDMNFTPYTWSVKRVPLTTLVLEAQSGDFDTQGLQDEKYFDSNEYSFETSSETRDAENKLTASDCGFVFYMPESRKSPKANIPAGGGYAMREERNHNFEGDVAGRPGQEFENTDFTYANDNSPYVEMSGNLSYTNSGGTVINADIRFTVHLGHFSETDPNNYQTNRNVSYTYNVTVKGINTIVVEVESSGGEEQELRPGYAGDVVYSANKVFELDSHYDRFILQISRNEISDAMTFSVNTPFSKGMYDPAGEFDPALYDVQDYKWIKFAINRDFGENRGNYYVKYPGDQCYDDPDINDGTDNQPSGYGSHPGNARLLDVYQLIERLKTEAGDPNSTVFDTNGDVWISAFVDENLYYRDPTRPGSGVELSLWKTSVDKNDRQMHIITDQARYSPDGESSMITSLYTFKQRAIRTVFNVENDTLLTAWGLESFMENKNNGYGGRLYAQSSNASNLHPTSSDNGRENTMVLWDGKHWTDVLTTSSQYELRSSYNSAMYACLMRNRDLNGNDVVDPEEVRWYLASINQLTEIYYGEYALDQEARLYPRNAADRPGGKDERWHYVSSTYDGSEPWVIWSEEGASRGKLGRSSGSNGDYYAYRCLRNLGIPLEDPGKVPQKLVNYADNGDGSYTFNLANMNVKSLRQYSTIYNLPEHTEQEETNLPYSSFTVSSQVASPEPVLNVDYDGWILHRNHSLLFTNESQVEVFQNTDYNPCPPGYRIPNMRELMMYTSMLPEEAWKAFRATCDCGDAVTGHVAKFMCQTKFSLCNQGSYNAERQGFYWDYASGNFILRNNNTETGYVRCVRDGQ